MGVKRVLTCVVAFCSIFALASCDIDIKVKDTTKAGTTTQRTSTTKGTKTGSTSTTRKNTSGSNTSNTTQANVGNGEVLNFYCWNDEVVYRFRQYYGDSEKLTNDTDLLSDGTKVKWIMHTITPDPLDPTLLLYQDYLDAALEEGTCDLFCFESDYAKKYVDSQYVVDLATLGIDQSRQFKFTKDVVTNANGKVVGTSWACCPGVICYNENIAKLLFDNEDEYSINAMRLKLNTKEAFDQTAAQLENIDSKYAMIIGPHDGYRCYTQNLEDKMYNGGTTLTIDKQLFRYMKSMKTYNTNGYLLGDDFEYYLWSEPWCDCSNAKSNVLTLYSTTWYNYYCIDGYKTINNGAVRNCEVDQNGSSPWRVVEGYGPNFWGGTWISPTSVGISNNAKKNAIKSILSKLTTDKATLRAMSDGTQDFTNNMDAMGEKGTDTSACNAFFGGQNVFAVYSASAVNINADKMSLYHQQIIERFQSAFISYIDGSKTASSCWNRFLLDMSHLNSTMTITAASGVTIDDDITIA